MSTTYEDIRTILNRIDGLNVDEHQYQPFPEKDEFDINEDEDFEEVLGVLGFPEDELWEAEYRGRKVPLNKPCLLYTSPSPRDLSTSRMPSSA